MSIATIGAVAATDTELLIPGIPQIPYALLLTGAGGTTEVIEVRSLQRGGHVYVTRGAFGSLPVAHTAPVVVSLYDPNSGGGGGGGVTVTGSDGSQVASATEVQLSGPVSQVSAGVVSVSSLSIFEVIVNYNTPGWIDAFRDVIPLVTGQYILDCGYTVITPFAGSTDPSSDAVALYATGSDTNKLTPPDPVDQPPATFGIARSARADMLVNWSENPKYVVSNGFLRVKYATSDTGPAPTSGSLKVWAMIATPAS